MRKRPFLLTLLLAAAINLPWMVTFWSVSNVGSFVSADKKTVSRGVASEVQAEAQAVAPVHVKAKPKEISAHTAVTILREAAVSTNPLLLILLVPALALLRGRTRIIYCLTAVWLLVLGAVIGPLKPQLELDRMLVILTIVEAAPCAFALFDLSERAFNSGGFDLRKLTCAGLGSFLIAGPWALGSFLEGRTLVQFAFAGPVVRDMADAITKYGGDGRVLFSGFILHELSGGHVAPLALMTGKPLMASSHVHNMWRYQQIFPHEYIEQGEQGIERYLDLYNVTAVIAHERNWRDRFLARPDFYEPVWKEERFILFVRKNAHPSYFLEGEGTFIRQNSNSVTLEPKSAEATIKFNYLPFLTSDGCNLSPAKISENVTLIRLSGCTPGKMVTIKSRGALGRLLNR